MRSKVDKWFEEYTFLKRYINGKLNEEISETFIEITKKLIKG